MDAVAQYCNEGSKITVLGVLVHSQSFALWQQDVYFGLSTITLTCSALAIDPYVVLYWYTHVYCCSNTSISAGVLELTDLL